MEVGFLLITKTAIRGHGHQPLCALRESQVTVLASTCEVTDVPYTTALNASV